VLFVSVEASDEGLQNLGPYSDGSADAQVNKLAAVAEAVDGRCTHVQFSGDIPD
jgi:hypothetical protein